MENRGFTLIELIIVVIIIGVLASLAIPEYLKAIERAKGAKAWNAMVLISKAEKMYRAAKDTYVNVNATQKLDKALGAYIELNDVDSDTDWDYRVTGANVTAFTINATRERGACKNATVTLDQDGYWAGNFFGNDTVPSVCF